MTITELFTQLNTRGLSLKKRDGDLIELVGDGSKLTDSIKAALGEHKETLLAALPGSSPSPQVKPWQPPESQWWWDSRLSAVDNAALDSFMGYGSAGPAGDVQDIYLTDGCQQCGSILGWTDLQGNHHCLGCDPVTPHPAPGLATVLREKATARQGNPKVPNHGPLRRRR